MVNFERTSFRPLSSKRCKIRPASPRDTPSGFTMMKVSSSPVTLIFNAIFGALATRGKEGPRTYASDMKPEDDTTSIASTAIAFLILIIFLQKRKRTKCDSLPSYVFTQPSRRTSSINNTQVPLLSVTIHAEPLSSGTSTKGATLIRARPGLVIFLVFFLHQRLRLGPDDQG